MIYVGTLAPSEGKGCRGRCTGPRPHERGGGLIDWHEARRGTVVRVREDHWKTEFAGMLGTIRGCWGRSEHAAVDVLMADGRRELFRLPNLDAVGEDLAV